MLWKTRNDLTITSYNVGIGHIRRAIKKHKKPGIDLEYLIKYHKSSHYGFASQNFYASFMAVKEISENPKVFFDQIEKEEPINVSMIYTPSRLSTFQIAQSVGMEPLKLADINPAIKRYAFKVSTLLPKRTLINIPVTDKAGVNKVYAKLNGLKASGKSARGKFHKVRRGENLKSIARKYGTNWKEIASINEIRNPSKIHVGKKLLLPTKDPVRVIIESNRSSRDGFCIYSD